MEQMAEHKCEISRIRQSRLNYQMFSKFNVYRKFVKKQSAYVLCLLNCQRKTKVFFSGLAQNDQKLLILVVFLLEHKFGKNC